MTIQLQDFAIVHSCEVLVKPFLEVALGNEAFHRQTRLALGFATWIRGLNFGIDGFNPHPKIVTDFGDGGTRRRRHQET
ncbi:MAG: hypothetical protein AAF989_07290 [Planctomycetota bacterium]